MGINENVMELRRFAASLEDVYDDRNMDAQHVSAELDRELFKPVYLHLTDGAVVEVPVPYFSYINRKALFIAQAVRHDCGDRPSIEFIPLTEIAVMKR